MHLAPAVVSRGICRADGFPSREARRSLNEARYAAGVNQLLLGLRLSFSPIHTLSFFCKVAPAGRCFKRRVFFASRSTSRLEPFTTSGHLSRGNPLQSAKTAYPYAASGVAVVINCRYETCGFVGSGRAASNATGLCVTISARRSGIASILELNSSHHDSVSGGAGCPYAAIVV